MPAVVVIFDLPVADHDPGMGHGPEQVEVEAFVAEPAVEGFDVAVPPGLAGWDERQPDAFAGPIRHRGAGQFGAVVAAQHGWVAAVGGEPVEFVDQLVAGNGAFDESAEAFAGVLVDDGDNLDRPAIGGGVELEVDRPHSVRRLCGHRLSGGGAEPFAAAALRHPEPFVAPQPLDLLVVDVPALPAGVVVGPTVTPPRVGFGVVRQPLPQPGVRVDRRRRGGSPRPPRQATGPGRDPPTNGCSRSLTICRGRESWSSATAGMCNPPLPTYGETSPRPEQGSCTPCTWPLTAPPWRSSNTLRTSKSSFESTSVAVGRWRSVPASTRAKRLRPY